LAEVLKICTDSTEIMAPWPALESLLNEAVRFFSGTLSPQPPGRDRSGHGSHGPDVQLRLADILHVCALLAKPLFIIFLA